MGSNINNPGNQFDLIIVGGGSAAFAAAIKANDLKLNTLLANDSLPLGGTCVNVGCVPSKFLIRAAEHIYYTSHSPFEGITPRGADIDFKKIIQQKKQLVEDMQKRKYVDLLEGLQFVTVLDGTAEFNDKQTLIINNQEYKGLKIIIATGSTTAIPSIEGLNEVQYLTNDTLFDLEELPQSLIIIGGGYIGLEIAQAYSRFGTKVTIVEMEDRILSTETKDITDELTETLTGEGIEIITNASIKRVSQKNQNMKVEMENKTIEATHLVIATGRKANTEKLSLDKAGIDTVKKGYIKVNEQFETNVSGVYAIGDVNTFPQFVYTAANEGTIAISNAFEGKENRINFEALPWVVFTNPQVAGVGMDEKAAEENSIGYEITVLPLSEVPRSIVSLNTRGFIKLIKNPETDLLLGARIVAPEGSELAMEISLAIRHKITIKEIVEALHPYLTLSEGIKLAAMSFTTDVKKMSCCAS
jgi:mercuric reductase